MGDEERIQPLKRLAREADQASYEDLGTAQPDLLEEVRRRFGLRLAESVEITPAAQAQLESELVVAKADRWLRFRVPERGVFTSSWTGSDEEVLIFAEQQAEECAREIKEQRGRFGKWRLDAPP